MKSTPENNVKRLIKVLLAQYNCFHYSATAGAFSTAGIPDIVGCANGRFFGVEAKAPGKKPTALQLMQKDRIEAAGGKWFLIDGDTTELETWLKEVRSGL